MEVIEVMDTLDLDMLDMEDMVLDMAVVSMERGPLMQSPRQRLMLIFMGDMEAIEVMDTLDLDMLDMEDMVLDTAVVSTMDKEQLSTLLKQKLKVISDWQIVVNQCPH